MKKVLRKISEETGIELVEIESCWENFTEEYDTTILDKDVEKRFKEYLLDTHKIVLTGNFDNFFNEL